MFEEEAEEYKDNTRIKDKNTYIGFPDERISEVQDYEGNYIDISERIIKTFKDGAEFGYNCKAKEEMQEQGLALQSDMDKTIEQNIALKKELNKANEWHFTNRNKEHLVIDCPKGEENKLYLLLLNSRDSKEYEFGRKVPVVCYWNEKWRRFERLEHTIGERNVNPNDINAWKEIELPKEIENER